MPRDSKERFSDRVDDYVKFRPSYPDDVVGTLRARFGLSESSYVVDVGSGTGISSELFLRAGCSVTGVEPNAEMRAAAEKLLAKYPKFRSVSGSAEATSLPDACADLVLAAQAFHWFDPAPTRREWRRILKPGGHAAVLFNDRDARSPFGADYEKLLKGLGSDYEKVKHRNVTEKRHREFLGDFEEFRFPNHQRLDFGSLLGRLKSSSYSLKESDAGYAGMVRGLRAIFDRHQRDGYVAMEYTTELFVSRLEEGK